MVLLHCGKPLIITNKIEQPRANKPKRYDMREVWDTKDGRRRVRLDPPTVEDAAIAAQGLTDDIEGQVQIVASLMPVSAQEARHAVLKMKRSADDSRVTIPGRTGALRAVVVERKPRRATPHTFASVGQGRR
jgi:hypothetical protein